jgi:hypothetical protein
LKWPAALLLISVTFFTSGFTEIMSQVNLLRSVAQNIYYDQVYPLQLHKNIAFFLHSGWQKLWRQWFVTWTSMHLCFLTCFCFSFHIPLQAVHSLSVWYTKLVFVAWLLIWKMNIYLPFMLDVRVVATYAMYGFAMGSEFPSFLVY